MQCPSTPYLYYQSFLSSFMLNASAEFKEALLSEASIHKLKLGDTLFEASSEDHLKSVWYVAMFFLTFILTFG